MKDQLTLARNQIFNVYTCKLSKLINVNAHVEFLFHGTLLTKIPTTKKFQKNSFLAFQVLVFNTFPVLVTPLQFPLTKKEAHQLHQMLILQHTTSSCWRLTTFCPPPHSTGTGTHSTRASLRNANTSPLHEGGILPKARVCGQSKLRAGEPTAFTRHLFLKIG